MASKPGRKPDYNVNAKIKNTNYKGKIGGAWRNEDGTIAIRLDPFIVLKSDPELLLTLFPNDETSKLQRFGRTDNDEIPF